MSQILDLPPIYDEVRLNLNNYSKWSVIIGPEGGFSNEERELIKKQKNVLRVIIGFENIAI